MDVGKLFNLPQVSSSAVNKRKWNDKVATTALPTATPVSEPAHKAARVEDERLDDDKDVTQQNVYEEDDDDEDGRFFSGGLSKQQAHILDIMDRDSGQDAAQAEVPGSASFGLDLAGLRKQMVRFERTITRNAEMRVKYVDDPARFIDSEADLDSELKSLLVLTTDPTTFYPEFIRLGGAASLVSLLTHENADISAAAIEVLEELTDEDVGQHDNELAETPATLQALSDLVDSLLEQNVADLLVSNLARFHDQADDIVDLTPAKRQDMENDAQAINHTLTVLTNLVTLRPALIRALSSSSTSRLLPWIMARIGRKTDAIDQNTAYAAELLAVLAHLSPSCRPDVAQVRVDRGKAGYEIGMDVLLGIVARFRRRGSGSGVEEVEFLENVLDVVCALVSAGDPDVGAVRNVSKQIFLDAEGIELMVLLLSAKTCTVPRLRLDALRVLGHALSGPDTHDLCLRFVESQGLAPLFALLMMDFNSTTAKHGSTATRMSHTHVEHLLAILASLFTHLPSDTEPRLRLLAKFVTKSYEKVDRLVELRATLTARIDKASTHRTAPTYRAQEDDAEDVYMAKLDVGLFSLQLLDTVLAWLVMEDDAVRDHLFMLLARHNLTFKHIVATLQGNVVRTQCPFAQKADLSPLRAHTEYHDNIGDQMSVLPQTAETHTEADNTELRTKDILQALIVYLDSL